jgi:CRP/FNR family transcriptional regulator
MKERGKTVPVHPGEIRAVDDLATSRVVIPRLLKKLENEGRILLYRHEIKIPNEL